MKLHLSRQVPLVIALVLLPLSTISAQSQSSTVWFRITDTARGHDSLVLGNDVRATYCVDSTLGENQSPPYPPGFSAVFVSIPGRVNCFGTLGIIKRDLRPFPYITNYFNKKDTFDINFVNTDSIAALPNVKATLRWPDVTNLRAQRCDSLFLVDRASGFFIPTRIDMFAQDSVVLVDPYIYWGPPTSPTVKIRIFKYTSTPPDAVQDQSFPQIFALNQNYPNPFNPSTTISYGLPYRSHVSLTMYNLLGMKVKTIAEGDQDAGTHKVVFDGTRLASGVYYYRLQVDNHTQTKKAVILK